MSELTLQQIAFKDIPETTLKIRSADKDGNGYKVCSPYLVAISINGGPEFLCIKSYLFDCINEVMNEAMNG